MLGLVLCGLLIVIILVVSWMWMYPHNPTIQIVGFFRPTCPACKSMLGEWDLLKRTMPRSAKTVEVDCDDQSTTEMRRNFGVTSVPSIWKVYSDGRRYQYPSNAPRTAEALIKFSEEINITQVGEKDPVA